MGDTEFTRIISSFWILIPNSTSQYVQKADTQVKNSESKQIWVAATQSDHQEAGLVIDIHESSRIFINQQEDEP
jgi:frataxin-like iron-binding protein CyaY